MSHLKNCKSFETGFEQSCDCGVYEQKPETINELNKEMVKKIYKVKFNPKDYAVISIKSKNQDFKEDCIDMSPPDGAVATSVEGVKFTAKDEKVIKYRKPRRLGKFYLSNRIVEDIEKRLYLFKLFGKMIVTRCEYLYYLHKFEYIAESSYFDEHKIGEPIPQYLIEFDNIENKFYFTKI